MRPFRLIAALLLLAFASLGAEAANRFAVCTTACTWDASNTGMWSGSTGGATGVSVPGTGDAVIFDGATCVGGTTCTTTVGAGYNPSVQSFTMGACTASTTGCIIDFSANDNNLTSSGAVSVSGTGTRTLNMGDGTWTITVNSGNAWIATTVTGLTFNANGSTIVLTGTGGKSFVGGGLTYNNLNWSSSASTTAQSWQGNNTFNNVTFSNVTYVNPGTAANQTINGTFTANGTSTAPIVFIHSTGGSWTLTVANANTLDWTAFSGVTVAGAGSVTANNSYSLVGNSGAGLTINAPAGGGGANPGIFGN